MSDVSLPVGADLAEPPAEYPVHPAAAAFRMHTEDELRTLVASIKANGLFDPIMLDTEGKQLLDGRNRLEACRRARVEPRFERLPFHVDPVEYIVAHNIARRDLSKGQKALALALLYPEPERGRGKIDPARKDAAGAQFSYRRVQEARQILRYPDLVEMVRQGTKPFDEALAEAIERARSESSGAEWLRELVAGAPDLATLVADGQLSLAEAWAAFKKREAEAEAQEANKRETLLRICEAAYRGVEALSHSEFTTQLFDRLNDEKFRQQMTARLRLENTGHADINQGAIALGELLRRLGR